MPFGRLAIPLLVTLGVGAAGGEEPLSRYAGTWVGSRLVQPTGECRVAEPMKPVELTLDVRADGTVLASMGRAFVGKGTISTAGELLLVNERAFAMCGMNERRYVKRFEGRVRRVGEELRLELKAEDPACPPRCVFVEEYRVTRREPPAREVAASAPEITDDDVRRRVILQRIADTADHRGGGPRPDPVAYCIAVDPARDEGDPHPDEDRPHDRALFMEGPRDDPSPELIAALRRVHAATQPASECPSVEPADAEWSRHPRQVVVRKIFRLDDGTMKVPVMAHSPRSGCYAFAFYRVVPGEGGWRVESPRRTQSLCID
jgi:hypothetical protein